jgi:hypothetical protein
MDKRELDTDHNECTNCRATMHLDDGMEFQEDPKLRVCHACAHELHEKLRKAIDTALFMMKSGDPVYNGLHDAIK